MPAPSYKHRPLIVHSDMPLNAEPSAALLRQTFITPPELFYIRCHGDIPEIDSAIHRVSVTGRVAKPLCLSLDDIKAMPKRTVRAVMQCAGNRRADLNSFSPVSGDSWATGAIGCADWTGVSLAHILTAADADLDDALHVAFTAADVCAPDEGGAPYGVSLPMSKALHPDTIVAYDMNGAPLAREHGFPLRLVTPGWAGVRSPKWLSAITVQEEPSDAYQQANDYKLFPPDIRPDTIDLARGITIEAMPLNAAISEPAPAAMLRAGRVVCRGYAIASERAIVRVDLSSDGGRSWTQAVVEDNGDARWAWFFWCLTLDLLPGEHELCVRAWDAAGQTQPSSPDDVWNCKGYLSTSWHRVRVTAA